jgi:acyl-homoserine-lactone acylase
VHPRVITHFEPWMALSFSEGSIGGDIERVPLSQLEAFYRRRHIAMTEEEKAPATANRKAPTALPSRPRTRRTAMRCC